MAKEVFEIEPLAGSNLHKSRKPVNYRPIPHRRRSVHFKNEIPAWMMIFVAICMLGIFTLAYYLFQRLPAPLRLIDEERYPDRFIAERAAIHIKNLTDLGDRVAGTTNNEVLAMNLILAAVDKIRQEAHTSNLIEVDRQVGNGSYYRDKRVYPQLNVYRGIQNIVVKLDRKNNDEASNNYILINAHIDTVVMSPGE